MTADRSNAMARSWMEQIEVLDLGLAALAMGSGVTDVTTFLTLGDVFTSAMTGNTALLGIALSQGRLLSAAHSFSALLGFAIGAALGATIYLGKHPNTPGNIKVIRPLLLIEIFCLGVFAAMLNLTGPPAETGILYALILLSAIGMGIQGVAARH